MIHLIRIFHCILLLVGLLVSYPIVLFSQDFQFSYKMIVHQDSTNLNFVKEENAFLFVKDNSKSYFFSENFAKKDSILKLIEEGKVSAVDIVGNPTNLYHTHLNQHISKFYNTFEIEIFERILMKNYKYKYQSNFNWKIQPDSAVIKGYRCHKALGFFGGRLYEAWFTREIPIQDGPYVFCGLPGLIVEIYDSKKHYHFTLLSVRKLDNLPFLTSPYFSKGAIETTRKQVFEVRERLRTQPLLVLQAEGVNILETPELEQKRKQKQKTDNNPLELRVD